MSSVKGRTGVPAGGRRRLRRVAVRGKRGRGSGHHRTAEIWLAQKGRQHLCPTRAAPRILLSISLQLRLWARSASSV